MSNNFFWRLGLILAVFGWSAYEMYPPTGHSLSVEFRSRAMGRDAAYTNLLQAADALQQKNPSREFANLLEAAGTNDLQRYFPFFEDAKKNSDPNRFILNQLQREAAGKIKLGLDLQGGTSFLVGVDLAKATIDTDASSTNAAGTNAAPAVDAADKNQRILSQAVEVLRKRVDKFGVAEPLIQPAGNDRILIQLPGLSEADKDSARTQIQKAAYLEFRLVHPDSDRLVQEGTTEPGYEFKRMPHQTRDGREIAGYLVTKKPAHGLTGKYVKFAMATRNSINNSPEIELTFNSQGADLFGEITTENVNHQLAIVLDGEIYSAPNINEPIMGGSARISGNFTVEEAQQLANVLENPLETPVKIIESRDVDPSLGKDSIKSGINASLWGTGLVVGFMLLYYMIAGFVANIALLLNIVIVLGVMCSVGTTFTLPGIAGVVLTVGMAVDANVLIYERLREELAAGKSMRGAISAGYSKAFGTIFDSHVTTLISSVILIFMGTGPVKGFGVTLTIGVSASLFTALVVTRLIFDFLLDRGWLKSLPMLHVIRAANLDFMKLAKFAFVVSLAIILAGLGYGIGVRGKKTMGIDFAGGDQQVYAFAQKVDVDKLDTAIKALNIGEPSIQYQKELTSQSENLRITTAFNTADRVQAELNQRFPEAKFGRPLSVDKVGPTVGGEILRAAIMASLLSMFGILVYVALRYEFSFAIGAIVAVIHDVVLALGCYCLAGKQFNATTVAAVLTIIGFSLNDKVVIFDRIREDLKLGVRGTFREVINKALNQTLSRTIITSFTVLLSTLSLYIFGGGQINDFAFMFLVGIITGTYSSIYIASAFVLWWHKGVRPDIGSQVSMQGAEKTSTPAAV
jgi:SecD/SecF fusion protein